MPDFSFTLLLALCVVVGGAALLVLHRQSSRVADQSVAELRLRIAELSEQVQMGEVVMQNQARRIERLGWELAQLHDKRRRSCPSRQNVSIRR